MNINDAIYEKIKGWDETSISNVGNYSQQLVDRCRHKSNLTVIDVGANSGTFFDQLLNGLDVQHAVLFEPQKELFQYLTSKYKNNSNILVQNDALSDGRYRCRLNDDVFREHTTNLGVRDNSMNLGLSKVFYDDERSDIETESFDNIAHRYKLDKIDIIKIDTEGDDLRVLRGFTKTVSSLKEKPIILFELNWNGTHTYEEAKGIVDEFCKSAGYDNNVDLNRVAEDCFLIPI